MTFEPEAMNAMYDLLKTERRIDPEYIRKLYEGFSREPDIQGRDVIGLTILAMTRAAQQGVFQDLRAGESHYVPSRSDFLGVGWLVVTAVVDFVGAWRSASASDAFDNRTRAALGALDAFDDWSQEVEEAWRCHQAGDDVGLRLRTVLALRMMVFTKVYPRKIQQFPFAAKEALGRLDELSDPGDLETTGAEVRSGLFEARQQLSERGQTGLLVGKSGQLLLGWRQTRDALEASRGLDKRKIRARRKAEHAELVEEALAAQDLTDLVDQVADHDMLDKARIYIETRLRESRPDSNLWHVLNHLPEIATGDLTPTALARELARDPSRLIRVAKAEVEALRRAIG